MKLSILIVTWNSSRDIEACIDSVNFDRQFEVIVVDNASTDDTRDRLARFHHLKAILNDRNHGYAWASNQALKLAQGEYVLLLNPDTRLTLGAIATLADFLDAHPEAGAVAPRLVYPDGRTQLGIRGFPTASNVLSEILGLSRLFPASRVFGGWRLRRFNYDCAAPVDQPMASCLMLRRAVLDQLGGFDTGFPIYFNDVDLSRRMADQGWKTFYIPDATVEHRVGGSTGQVRPRMIRESHRALFRYLRKHDRSGLFWLKAVWLLPLLEITALLRIIASRLKGRA